MDINDKLLDQLIAGYKKPEDKDLRKRSVEATDLGLLERAMQAEMTDHLRLCQERPCRQEHRQLTKRKLSEKAQRRIRRT